MKLHTLALFTLAAALGATLGCEDDAGNTGFEDDVGASSDVNPPEQVPQADQLDPPATPQPADPATPQPNGTGTGTPGNI